MTSVRPFRTSTSARLISLAVATALGGGGAAVLTGSIDVMAVSLLIGITLGIIGFIVGTLDYSIELLVLAVLLPLALWPYAMLLTIMVERRSPYGWALIGIAAAMLAQTALASIIVRAAPANPEQRALDATSAG